MSGRGIWLSACAFTALACPALAQEWVTFQDETSTRLVADPSVGTADPDEKDYAFGDVDKDGDTDLISVRKEGWTTPGRRRNVLFMNEGLSEGHAVNGVLVDRTVEYASASLVAGSTGMLDLTNDRDIAVVDVDGDGWDDLVTATTLSGDQAKYISHPRVYINLGIDGNGEWLGFLFDDEDRTPTMPAEPRFCAVAFGDIDKDGDNDLYFADYQQQPANWPNRPQDLNDRLLINDGTGYFTDQSADRMTAEMLESSFGMAAGMADMNGDGWLDILKDDALNAPQAISISYNDPADPGFFDRYSIPKPGQQPYHLVTGDLNNDGRLDIIETDDGSDHYLINNGNGSDTIADFSTFTFSFTGGESDDGFGGDNYIADLNNDGWNDVVITDVDVDISGCGRRTHIYRNLGNAPNVTLQEQTVGTNCGNGSSQTCTVAGIVVADLKGTHDVAIFDINNDGWLDMVVGRCDSTEVYMNQPPIGMIFTYPQGLPAAFTEPNVDHTFQVQVTGVGSTPAPNSAEMHLSIDGGPFMTESLVALGGDLYEATLPGGACLTDYDFYFSVENTLGTTFFDPADAPTSTYVSKSALGEEITLRDEIEGDVSGWLIESDAGLTAGEWEQADPNQTFTPACGVLAPEDDAGGAAEAVQAFVTQNGTAGGLAGASDVDGSFTYLTSPVVDLAGSDATISYSQWFASCNGTLDVMTVEVTNDGGNSWVLVDTVTDTAEEWETTSFLVSDFVAPTDTIRVRYGVGDTGTASFTEAGIDNFEVRKVICPGEPTCEGDANGDGQVDPLDSGYVQARFGCLVGAGDAECDAADVNVDTVVDPLDVGFVLARFGTCP